MVALSSILLPLYIYPSPSAWLPIYNSIAANPSVTFSIIVNPSNGPGTAALPDSSYIAGISKLKSYPNTALYGYVHTLYATRAISDVKVDIARYRGWSSYKAKNISMSGIFFDETPSQNTATNYNYMSELSKFSRLSSLPRVIFNPGTTSSAAYYALADQIVMFENTAKAYGNGQSVMSSFTAAQAAKTSIIMYGFSGTAATLKTAVRTLATKGVKSVFISTAPGYTAVSSMWTQFCANVGGA